MFKWYDELLFSNYKPVSVLSVFSNVPERLMHHRLITYIYQNRLLYNLHFGFQKGKFTRMALIAVIDKISEALDNGDFVIGVFLNSPRRLIQLITAFFSEIFLYALKGFMLDKFLAVHMDLKCNWKNHIEYTCKNIKMHRSYFVLYAIFISTHKTLDKPAMHVAHYRLDIRRTSMKTNDVNTWNLIPLRVIESTSIEIFNPQLRKYSIDQLIDQVQNLS